MNESLLHTTEPESKSKMNPIYHNMGMFILMALFLVDRTYAYGTAQQSTKVSLHPMSTSSSVLHTVIDTPNSQTTQLSPLLQQLVDERRLYELNLGKAMDTLRRDYSTILIQSPDFSIYSEDIGVLDPSGVQLQGLSNYKTAFAFLQTIVRFFYNTALSASYVQHRMVYDFARQSIRISWNAVLTPKVMGDSARVYLDGISVYKLDMRSGKIVEHKIEKMVVNGSSILPPYGVLSTLKDVLVSAGTGVGRPVPAGVGAWGFLLTQEPHFL